MVHTLNTTQNRRSRTHKDIDKTKAQLLTQSINSNKELHSVYVEYNPKRVAQTIKVLRFK